MLLFPLAAMEIQTKSNPINVDTKELIFTAFQDWQIKHGFPKAHYDLVHFLHIIFMRILWD